MPRVSFGNAVLTDGAHWKVFAKCVLMTVPKGPIMYGFVPELKRYGSAAGLAWSMNQVGLLKHKVWRKTASEKLNYLERLVMATRLRMLTAQEKDAAVSAIQQYGIVRASYIYLANWYASTYYQKHYDYSKKKSPWYISYLIEGKYVNAANQPIENLNYSVPIELLAGYFLKGKTAVDGKFKNQVFHPVVFPFRAMPYIVNATLGDLRQTFVRDLDFLITSGVKLVFTGLPENPTSSDIWPRPEIARNPLTESLGFASLGDGAGCSKPEVISATGVVHPANWQQYIDCRLGAQSATFSSLLNRNDAVAYLQIRFSEYLNTAAAIYKSDQQSLELLLSIITFREPTSAEKANITSALNSGSIDSVMSDMLLSWYYSFAYGKFNFRKQSSLSKRNI